LPGCGFVEVTAFDHLKAELLQDYGDVGRVVLRIVELAGVLVFGVATLYSLCGVAGPASCAFTAGPMPSASTTSRP
jgi:hypothetical protein